MDEHPADERAIGWRDLLGAVNLGDFADMVRNEVRMISSSVTLAFESLQRLPIGPVFFALGMVMAFIRAVLLFFVVIFFGSGILALTVARKVSGIFRRRPQEPPAGPTRTDTEG